MSTWYERNKEKTLARSKEWRLNNLERYRQLQKAAKARKRGSVRAKSFKNAHPDVVPWEMPPEGYDPVLHGSLEDWKWLQSQKIV